MALPGGFSGEIAARGARTICVALSTQLTCHYDQNFPNFVRKLVCLFFVSNMCVMTQDANQIIVFSLEFAKSNHN